MVCANVAEWGRYAPPPKSFLLRVLIKIGLGRGAVRAFILNRWQRDFGSCVDICVRGINYRLDISNNVTDGKILASSTNYDRRELEFLESECRDGVFIDIGANIGYYSLVLAKKSGCRVIAVEPNPPVLERLRFNVQINETIKNQITIVPLGVGSHGEFEIHSEGNLGAASLHKKIFNEPKNGVKIKTKPLFEILKELGVKRVDALKIDIEGMEDQALAPYLINVSPEMLPKCIVIEDDHQDLWEVDLMKILFDLGYKEVSRTRSNAILHREK